MDPILLANLIDRLQALQRLKTASIPLESVMQRLNEQHWPIVGGACYAHWRKTEDSIGLRSRSGFQPH